MIRHCVAALLALLLGLACAPAHATDTLDALAWRQVLAGMNRDLDRRAQEVRAVRDALPALSAELSAQLSFIDNRLSQAMILRGVAGRNPWTLRTLINHVRSLERELSDATLRLEQTKEHLAAVRRDNQTLQAIRTRAGNQAYDDATVAELEKPARKLTAITAEVDALRQEVELQLDQARGLDALLLGARENLRGEIREVFQEHFFTRTHPPLDGFGLSQVHSRLRDWREDFPRFALPTLAWLHWFWLAGIAAGIWLVLQAGTRLGARLLQAGRDAARARAQALASAAPGKQLPEQDGAGAAGCDALSEAPAPPGASSSAARDWLACSVGLSLTIAGVLVPFGFSHVTEVAFTTLTTWGAVRLVRDRLSPGTLDFFFVLFALISLTQLLNIPAEVLCLLWPAAAGTAAALRWREGRQVQAAALAASGIAAVSGFGPLAMALVQAWFVLLLTLAVTRCLRAALREVGGAWYGYVLPLAATVVWVGYLAWVLLYIGGTGFLEFVFALEMHLGPVSVTLDAVSVMAVLFFVVRLALAWLKAWLERACVGGKVLDPALSHTLSTLSGYALWLSYVLVALHVLGVPLTGLTWIASGLSVGVGFGLKDIINNFVSGLIILFGGAIKKGDVVQTGKTLGEVTTVSVRNTTVRTLDNSMVIIPNSSFLRGEIINWSYQDRRIRLTIHVSVVPGSKIKKVRKILLGAAREHPLVLKDPAPSVMLRQLGKMGLDFELYVWIEDFRDKFRVESDLAATIDETLQDNKVTVIWW